MRSSGLVSITACSKNYISVPDPGIPPFYSRDFFTTIQKVSNTSTRNIFSITEKEWYNCVMEDSYTMEVGVSGRQEYVQCREDES